MTSLSKEFVIRKITDKYSELLDGESRVVTENHFGTTWDFDYCLYDEDLGAYELEMIIMNMDTAGYNLNEVLKVDAEFKLIYPNGDVTSSKQKRLFSKSKSSTKCLIKLDEEIEIDFNDTLTVEVHVKAERTTGPEKEDLIKFDESVKKFSDVVLVVEERKFYVSKMFLGFQSSYFDALLMGVFDESKKSEIVLNDIDPNDFQHFLELIHGESPLNDSTVDGILHLVDMYDAPIPLRRCEEFLLEKSQKRRDIKLKLAIQYKLENLKKKCLSEIKTRGEIQAIVDAGMDQLDLSVSKALLQKSLLLK